MSPHLQQGACRGPIPGWLVCQAHVSHTCQPEPRLHFWLCLVLINSSALLNHLPQANTLVLKQCKLLMPQSYLFDYHSEAEHFHFPTNIHFSKLPNYPCGFKEYFSSSSKMFLQVPETQGSQEAWQELFNHLLLGVPAGLCWWEGEGYTGAVRDPRIRAPWDRGTFVEISFLPGSAHTSPLRASSGVSLGDPDSSESPYSHKCPRLPLFCYIKTRFQGSH